MIIKQRVKGFVCLTAHPIGCKQNVREQIGFVETNFTKSSNLPKNVLVIGGTTGYGLASALTASFGCDANVLCVGYEKQADNGRTATAGFYNSSAFLEYASLQGKYAKCVFGDAFSDKCKSMVADIVSTEMGKIDLLIYSLASPKRLHPKTGVLYQSVLKPYGKEFVSKNLVMETGVINQVTLQPATLQEKENTIAVMGGEDWRLWIEFLSQKNLLSANAKTIAYSYIGPKFTHAIYKDGTIGAAKQHLKDTADSLNVDFGSSGLRAYVSIQKALVTQASSAIPVVPLYISILYDIMKKSNTHEHCIEQIVRLFKKLTTKIELDKEGYIRLDDWEMDKVVQDEVARRWNIVDTDNVNALADIEGYKSDFLKLFGFGHGSIDYEKDIEEKANEKNVVFI
ncbi:MAG: trans-2-enoyl-CoA reductase family protein [Clostridiales bacterium]|jgi:enoyl-[acyl-carrier protein] reductase/trans-2-enoyl-CoA reductase (NAD+)|nr:trans-2-enoyl-CoA reductase family protein [Clostridiales bacterium]